MKNEICGKMIQRIKYEYMEIYVLEAAFSILRIEERKAKRKCKLVQ
jgi:hypothetical protein